VASARQRGHTPISSSSGGSSAATAAAGAAAVAGAAGAAAGVAMSVRSNSSSFGGSSAAGKRAPPAPPAPAAAAPGAPQLSSASQGVRAHAVAVPSSPLDSPRRVSAADDSPDEAPDRSGPPNPFAAERSGSGGLHPMRWSGTGQLRNQYQQQQQQGLGEEGLGEDLGAGKLSQLQVCDSMADCCRC
jgi:hypothetical protein